MTRSYFPGTPENEPTCQAPQGRAGSGSMLEGGIRPMLRWISIFGGLLIMMGQHARSEALFYCFRLEDQVPEHHLLRLIDKHISFDFVRQQLKDSYRDTGRPSH